MTGHFRPVPSARIRQVDSVNATNAGHPTGAAAYVEGLEAYFGDAIQVVAARLRAAISSGPKSFDATGIDDFLDTYCEQVQELVSMPPEPTVLRRELGGASQADSGPFSGMPVLDVGETRPMLMLRVGDKSPWGARYPAGDAKTMLLYSNDLVLMDPTLAFAPTWMHSGASAIRPSRNLTRSEAARAFRRYHAGSLRAHYVPQAPTLEGLSREEWLVRSIEQYAALAPAIAKGYVETVFVNPSSPWSAWRPGEDYLRKWREQGDIDIDRNLIDESMRDILLAVSLAAASPGRAHVVARPGLEEDVLHYYRGVLQHNRRRIKTTSAIPDEADRTMMNRLFELNLHGVDFTKVKDLVTIRDADLFSNVRISMQQAVIAAERQTSQSSARAAAREVLRDHSDRLHPGDFGKSLRDAIVPNSVSYSLAGYSAAMSGSWQPMLPIATQAAIDVVSDRHVQKAIRAQRSLYVALSRVPT